MLKESFLGVVHDDIWSATRKGENQKENIYYILIKAKKY